MATAAAGIKYKNRTDVLLMVFGGRPVRVPGSVGLSIQLGIGETGRFVDDRQAVWPVLRRRSQDLIEGLPGPVSRGAVEARAVRREGDEPGHCAPWCRHVQRYEHRVAFPKLGEAVQR